MQQTIRVRFFKHDRAKYISHLDLMRCMTRVIRRAQIPVWYTQGFHPHLYITFAQPLSLGFESDCEFMEMQLVAPMELSEIKERLNRILPPEMQVTHIYLPQRKMEEIACSEFTLRMLPEQPSQQLAGALERLMEKEQWLVEKKSKKGIAEVDIRPHVQILDASASPEELRLQVRLPVGQNFTLNPNLLLTLLEQEAPEADCLNQVRRTAVYDEKGELFA